MLRITQQKGFQLEFSNGYTVSVQFGAFNYCENYNADFELPRKAHFWNSTDAEVAVLTSGGMVPMQAYDNVFGNVDADTVGKLIAFVQKAAPGSLEFINMDNPNDFGLQPSWWPRKKEE
jgi:hypothetical protein